MTPPAPMPADEAGRLRALAEMDLDASADPVLQGIVQVAADLIGAQVSSVNIVDDTRQWVKAAVGAELDSGPPRDESFCTHVVAESAAAVVEDARCDPRFADNAATVAGDIGSYAGFPLRTSDGHVVGSFCVWGAECRSFDERDLATLDALAAAAAGHLELRRTTRTLARTTAQLDAVLEHAPDAFIAMDGEGLVCEWNRESQRLFGWSRAEALGRSVAELIIPEQLRDAHVTGLRRYLTTGATTVLERAVEVRGCHRDGELVDLELRIAAVTVGAQRRFNAFARDISVRKALEAEQAELMRRLQALSSTDPLTGAANRRTLYATLDAELVRATRSDAPLTVIIADLDHFKAYNDTHGHAAGDEMLRACVAAWDGLLRGTDTLARYGGEEFVIVLPGCGAAEATAIAERLNHRVPGDSTCSSGVAIWDGQETADRLIERADTALYAAKAAGRSAVRVAGPQDALPVDTAGSQAA